MTIVNKFNVNNKQVTLDADIIENMSANDVPYNSSFQYNKNTVGDKLSKLELEMDKINNGEFVKPSNYTESYNLNTSGVLVANSTSRVSEYIPWSGETIVKVFRNTTRVGYLCGYDTDKNFITGTYWGFTTYRNINDTALSKASYLRFDFGSDAVDVRLLDANDQVVWETQDEKQLNLIELENKVRKNTENIQINQANINALVKDMEYIGINAVVKTYTWETGYRNYLGIIAISDLWKHTTPIAISNGDVVKANFTTFTSSVVSCCLVSANGEYIKTLAHNQASLYYLADVDCFIEFSVYVTDDFSPIFYSAEICKEIASNSVAINRLNDRVIELEVVNGNIVLENLRWIDKKTFSVGNEVSVKDAIITDGYIDITEWNTIRFIANNGNTYKYLVNFYDANKTFLIRKGWYEDGVIDCFASAKYIRISLQCIIDGTAIIGNVDNFGLDGLSIIPTLNSVEYPYEGKPIVIKPKVRWKNIANAPYTGSIQGAACYGSTLFQFYGREYTQFELRGCAVIDLETSKVIQEIELGYDATDHCNSVNFGTEKYTEDDIFPLLYTSGFRNYMIRVYRVLYNSGEYNLDLVQTITYPSSMSETSWFVDERGFLYAEWAISKTKANVAQFRLPSITDGTEVALTEDDRLDLFDISLENPYGVDAPGPEQDGIIYDGVLYQIYGFAGRNWLSAINLETKKVESTISMVSMGLNYEPEGIFYYKGNLGMSFNENGKIIELTFV